MTLLRLFWIAHRLHWSIALIITTNVGADIHMILISQLMLNSRLRTAK